MNVNVNCAYHCCIKILTEQSSRTNLIFTDKINFPQVSAATHGQPANCFFTSNNTTVQAVSRVRGGIWCLDYQLGTTFILCSVYPSETTFIAGKLDSFRLVTSEETPQLLSNSKVKSCIPLDPVHVKLIKDFRGVLVPVLTKILIVSRIAEVCAILKWKKLV